MITVDLYICSTKIGDVPLVAGTLTDIDVMSIDNATLGPADLIELRVDMFSNVSASHVEDVFKKARDRFRKPLIGTVRDPKEGGKQEIQDRVSLYAAIAPFSDLLDVEINSGDTLSEVKKICLKHKNLLIGSYHNFESTPDTESLTAVFNKGKSLDADIVKIAVMGKSREDLLRLISFTLKHRDEGLITISMGDEGMASRLFNPVCGSLITYGYVTQPTVPGQLSISELMYLFRRLKIRS